MHSFAYTVLGNCFWHRATSSLEKIVSELSANTPPDQMVCIPVLSVSAGHDIVPLHIKKIPM